MPALEMLDNMVPISDFSHGKSSAAFAKVGNDNPVVVLKRNAPAFVIVTPEEYRSAKQAEEDLDLLMLAIERTHGTSLDDCLTFDQFLGEIGVTQDQLNEMDEVDFE